MRVVISILVLFGLFSCGENNVPRPIGYFRIDLPKKEYRKIDSIPFPFSFDLPQYATADLKRTKNNEHFMNLDFNQFGAKIHISYLPIDGNLELMLEDSRSLAYKHTVKAQDIKEKLYLNPEEKVYGTYYQIDGNAASGSQFYLTDSSKHFVRGALYFHVEPNFDSIAPVQEFIQKDIQRFIESFKWKDVEQCIIPRLSRPILVDS